MRMPTLWKRLTPEGKFFVIYFCIVLVICYLVVEMYRG